MIDHADKSWLREPLVTRPERGLLHPDFSPEGDKVLDIECQIVASVKWAWERKAWAETRWGGEMSHTKGPWKVRWKTAFCNRAAIEPAIGEVYGAGDELRDNANLIAAAPELLEALESVLFLLKWVAEEYHDKSDLRFKVLSQIPAASAAIAKARGSDGED